MLCFYSLLLCFNQFSRNVPILLKKCPYATPKKVYHWRQEWLVRIRKAVTYCQQIDQARSLFPLVYVVSSMMVVCIMCSRHLFSFFWSFIAFHSAPIQSLLSTCQSCQYDNHRHSNSLCTPKFRLAVATH